MKKLSHQEQRILTRVFIIAFSLRLLFYVGILVGNPDGFFGVDSHGYWQLATNLIESNSFSLGKQAPLLPNHSRTPLFPLMLVLLRKLGLNAAGIVFCQLILSALVCVTAALFCLRLTNENSIGFTAGLLCAVDIPSISLSNLLLTETVFTLLLLLSCYYLIISLDDNNVSYLYLSAFILGLSALTRPVVIFLPPLMVLMLLRPPWKKPFLKIAGYLLVFLITISPWLIRNKIVLDALTLSTIGYNNLLDYRAAGVYSIKEGIPIEQARTMLREKAWADYDNDPKKSPVEYRKAGARFAWKIIEANRGIYIRNQLVSTINMLVRPLRSNIDIQLGLRMKANELVGWEEGIFISWWRRLLQKTSPLTVALVILQLALLAFMWPLFFYGCYKTVSRHLVIRLPVIIILYFALVCGGPESYARFRVPLLPFLASGAAYGLFQARNHLKYLRLQSC